MRELLTEFNQKFAPSLSSAVISNDGLVIASALPEQIDEDAVAGMSAALFSIGARSSEKFTGGNMEQMAIKSPEGYLLVNPINQHTLLTVIAQSGTGIERLQDEIRKTIAKITG